MCHKQAAQTSVVWHSVSTNVYNSQSEKKANPLLPRLGTPWLPAPFAQGPRAHSTGASSQFFCQTEDVHLAEKSALSQLGASTVEGG